MAQGGGRKRKQSRSGNRRSGRSSGRSRAKIKVLLNSLQQSLGKVWQKVRRWRGWGPLARGGLKWGFVAGIWGTIILLLLLAYFAHDLPSISDGPIFQRRPTITILASDGSFLGRYGDFQTEQLPLESFPQNLVHAILATEDRRFYQHFGLDIWGVLRAMFTNLRAGHMVQGGSTITQQLAKNLFLTPDRTLKRKVQEAMLALQLEHKWSKNQILTAYLNNVYLGSATYGFDAAARTYFGKPVADIDLHEAAILAGLLKAPSRYAPSANPDQAAERAETVLQAMLEAGYLTPDEFKIVHQLPPAPRRKPTVGDGARYFTDWVADQASAYAGYGDQDLTVITTLKPSLQRLAEQQAQTILTESGTEANVSQVAAVTLALDGAVRAMVGGASYQASQFNRAVNALRQPGSSFKPIIYLAGLEAGLTPDTLVEDAPYQAGTWQPTNFDGNYRGNVPLRDALAYSLNTATIRVLEQAGVSRARTLARRLGLTTPIGEDLGLALGTSEVTLIEVAGVYATFANLGTTVLPYAIREIRGENGRILYRHDTSSPVQAAPPELVAQLNSMMTGTLAYGTGQAARFGRPAAGKTGTTQDYRDAWFMGFTGNFVTGVWMGNDDNSPMKRITGGTLPARLWRAIMQVAEADLPVKPVPGVAGSHESFEEGTPHESPSLDDVLHNILGGER